MKLFVAMPFHKKFWPVWEVIRDACKSVSIEPYRVDQIPQIDNIAATIFKEIENSDIILVDFSGDKDREIPNPNVVTEATHARNHKKPTMILTQNTGSLPFDWRTHRAIVYENTPECLEHLKRELIENLQGLKNRLQPQKSLDVSHRIVGNKILLGEQAQKGLDVPRKKANLVVTHLIPEKALILEKKLIPEKALIPEKKLIPKKALIPEKKLIPEKALIPEKKLIPELPLGTPNSKKIRKQNEEIRKQNEKIRKQNEKIRMGNEEIRKQIIKQNEEIRKQNESIRLHNEERPKKNEEIRKQNEEIRKQNKEIRKQNEPIRKQNEPIRKQNEEICKQIIKQNNQIRKQNEEIKAISEIVTSSNNQIYGYKILRQVDLVTHSGDLDDNQAKTAIKEKAFRLGANGIINLRITRSRDGYVNIQGDAVEIEEV